jgi:hypothetical protein
MNLQKFYKFLEFYCTGKTFLTNNYSIHSFCLVGQRPRQLPRWHWTKSKCLTGHRSSLPAADVNGGDDLRPLRARDYMRSKEKMTKTLSRSRRHPLVTGACSGELDCGN